MSPLRSAPFAFAVAAALAGTALAQSTPIYGGPLNGTVSYSASDSPTNTSAGTGVGIANASISGTFTTQAFRLTTGDAQLLTTAGGFARGSGTNTLGTIVGQYGVQPSGSTSYVNRAVRWDAGSLTPTTLNGLPTGNVNDASNAYAVSTAGLAVGFSNVSDDIGSLGSRPVYWAAGSTTAVELGTLGRTSDGLSTNGAANVVNALGTTIAGTVTKYDAVGSNQGQRAVRWTPVAGATAAAQELGTVTGFTSPQASPYTVNAINTAGTVAGNYNSSLGNRAVRWDAGQTTATVLNPINVAAVAIFIPPRTSYAIGYGYSAANAVNDLGTTVGSSTQFSAAGDAIIGSQAVEWVAGSSTPVILAGLGSNASGSAANTANSINALGLIAGNATAYNAAGTSLGVKAVVWYSPTQVLNLNSLLSAADAANWTLTSATSISATNWVVGLGTYDPDGTGPLAAYSRSYLLQAPATFPVPEPTALAALGLTAAGLLRRRRA